MAKLKIGLICHDSIRNNQRVVITNLAKLIGDSCELIVVTGAGGSSAAVESVVSVITVPIPRLNVYGWGYASRARYRLEKECPDIVVCVSHPFPLGFILALTNGLFTSKLVIRMTGDQFSERRIHKNPIVRLRKRLMHDYLLPKIIARADAILCVGEVLANQLVERGVSTSLVKVLPQPVDARSPHRLGYERREDIRQALGISPSSKMVITVGSVTYGKGADRLPILLEMTESADPALHFVIVGTGALFETISRVDHPRFHILGAQPREQTQELIAASDILLHPTRRDALPNVVLEALLHRVTIVSTPVGEIPKYVSNIAETDEDLAALLVSSNLNVDPIPAWFSWDEQRESYALFFQKLADS